MLHSFCTQTTTESRQGVICPVIISCLPGIRDTGHGARDTGPVGADEVELVPVKSASFNVITVESASCLCCPTSLGLHTDRRGVVTLSRILLTTFVSVTYISERVVDTLQRDKPGSFGRCFQRVTSSREQFHGVCLELAVTGDSSATLSPASGQSLPLCRLVVRRGADCIICAEGEGGGATNRAFLYSGVFENEYMFSKVISLVTDRAS